MKLKLVIISALLAAVFHHLTLLRCSVWSANGDRGRGLTLVNIGSCRPDTLKVDFGNLPVDTTEAYIET